MQVRSDTFVVIVEFMTTLVSTRIFENIPFYDARAVRLFLVQKFFRVSWLLPYDFYPTSYMINNLHFSDFLCFAPLDSLARANLSFIIL